MSIDNSKKNHSVTIYDVAKASGVSYSTVSRVLNGFQYVKGSTRERVLSAADQLGYVANLQARSLAGGRSNIIGILVPTIDSSYITEIVGGIDDELAKVNYNLMLYTTHRHVGKESEYVSAITQGMTDGMLLVLPLAPSSYLNALSERGFPYVVIDQNDPTGEGSVVDATNRLGAYEAIEYLINLGHRRIGFITGLLEVRSTHERIEGYKAALTDHQIPVDETYVVLGNFWEQEGYQATQKLLQHPQPPAAIFASNDLSAFGAMAAVRDNGLSIPEDVSIVGFDDLPQAAYVHPKLTTVRQPLEQMGRTAVRLLMEKLDHPDRYPKHVTLATELILRESCQPPS